jgi:RND family efflux transporter, MFP subunit
MKKSVQLLSLLSVLLIASCSGAKKDDSATAVEEREFSVKVAVIDTASVRQTVEFTGNIEPMYKNNISSTASQRIEKIFVEVGDRVSKGQLLVQMEDVNYIQANLQFENLKLDLQRVEALYKAGGISQQQYDQLKTQVNVSQEAISNIDRNTKLLSPIDGIIVQRNFDNGDLAAGLPILVVMQMQSVKILINISEEFFPRVTVGIPVDISLDIYPDKKYKGKIAFIHPIIDSATKTFRAEVRIDNPQMAIRPGMFARAQVDFGTMSRIVVPDMAVIKQVGTNDRFVYVLNGNTVDYVKVELGKRVGSIYEVISGLEAGQRVVTAGHTGLIDKSKVKIVDSDLDLSI